MFHKNRLTFAAVNMSVLMFSVSAFASITPSTEQSLSRSAAQRVAVDPSILLSEDLPSVPMLSGLERKQSSQEASFCYEDLSYSYPPLSAPWQEESIFLQNFCEFTRLSIANRKAVNFYTSEARRSMYNAPADKAYLNNWHWVKAAQTASLCATVRGNFFKIYNYSKAVQNNFTSLLSDLETVNFEDSRSRSSLTSLLEEPALSTPLKNALNFLEAHLKYETLRGERYDRISDGSSRHIALYRKLERVWTEETDHALKAEIRFLMGQLNKTINEIKKHIRFKETVSPLDTEILGFTIDTDFHQEILSNQEASNSLKASVHFARVSSRFAMATQENYDELKEAFQDLLKNPDLMQHQKEKILFQLLGYAYKNRDATTVTNLLSAALKARKFSAVLSNRCRNFVTQNESDKAFYLAFARKEMLTSLFEKSNVISNISRDPAIDLPREQEIKRELEEGDLLNIVGRDLSSYTPQETQVRHWLSKLGPTDFPDKSYLLFDGNENWLDFLMKINKGYPVDLSPFKG